MKKIRIPRKKKKGLCYGFFHFPNVEKLSKYLSYFNIEDGMKCYGCSPEDLCRKFGCYIKDDVVWWNWVRYKHFGIEPQLKGDYKKYWDYFVSEGVIKIK